MGRLYNLYALLLFATIALHTINEITYSCAFLLLLITVIAEICQIAKQLKFVDEFGNENIEDTSVSEQSSTNESDSNEVISSQECKTQKQETSQKETDLEQQTTQPAQDDELEEKDTMPIPLEGGQLQHEPKEKKLVIMLPCKRKKNKKLAPKENKTEKQVEEPKKRTVHSEKKDTTQSPSSLDSIPFQSIDSGVGSLASRPSLTSGPDDSLLKNFGDISQKPKEANPRNRKHKHQRAKSDENLLDDTPETSHSFNDTISFSGNIGRQSRSSSPRRRKRNKKKSPSEIDLQKMEKKTLEEDWEPSSCTQVEYDTNYKSIFVLPTQCLHKDKGEIVYYRPLSSSSSDEVATTSYFYFH